MGNSDSYNVTPSKKPQHLKAHQRLINNVMPKKQTPNEMMREDEHATATASCRMHGGANQQQMLMTSSFTSRHECLPAFPMEREKRGGSKFWNRRSHSDCNVARDITSPICANGLTIEQLVAVNLRPPSIRNSLSQSRSMFTSDPTLNLNESVVRRGSSSTFKPTPAPIVPQRALDVSYNPQYTREDENGDEEENSLDDNVIAATFDIHRFDNEIMRLAELEAQLVLSAVDSFHNHRHNSWSGRSSVESFKPGASSYPGVLNGSKASSRCNSGRLSYQELTLESRKLAALLNTEFKKYHMSTSNTAEFFAESRVGDESLSSTTTETTTTTTTTSTTTTTPTVTLTSDLTPVTPVPNLSCVTHNQTTLFTNNDTLNIINANEDQLARLRIEERQLNAVTAADDSDDSLCLTTDNNTLSVIDTQYSSYAATTSTSTFMPLSDLDRMAAH